MPNLLTTWPPRTDEVNTVWIHFPTNFISVPLSTLETIVPMKIRFKLLLNLFISPGAVVGKYCMELAIKKAKDVGIGWVVAKGEKTKIKIFQSNSHV